MTPTRPSRLVLETPVRTPDGGGGHILAWTETGALWGEVLPRSARETTVGHRPTARVTHRVTIRREPGPERRPRPDQRLRLGDRVFAIHAIADEPGGATLTLWVEEGPFS